MITKQQVLGISRHALTYFGGWLASKGYLSQEEAFQLVGGLVTVIGVVWSIYDKVKVNQLVQSYEMSIVQLKNERIQDDSKG